MSAAREPGMRRIVVAAASTVSGLVLVLAYPTSLNRQAAPATALPGSGQSQSATGGAGSGASQSGSTSDGTVTGDAVMTQWGVVQVEVQVSGGKVASARAVQVPDGNPMDQRINSVAVPILEQETVAASSAQIDVVSGATVTSEGYISSLQSALDQAGL